MTTQEQFEIFMARKGHTTDKPQSEVLSRLKPCIHVGERVSCQTCGGQLVTCKLFNDVTVRLTRSPNANRSCLDCNRYETATLKPLPVLPPTKKTYTQVGKRHLVYHILPVSGNGVWRRGVDQLRLRWHLFTGEKIICVATGGTVQERIDPSERVGGQTRRLPVESIHTVRAYLPRDCHVIEVHNDPNTWELVSWPLLWNQVLESASDEDAVLYAHAKGVSRKVTSPCHIWTELLYTLSLDYWRIIEQNFVKGKGIVGSLIKMGPYFGGVLSTSRWHFSGNFWWVRAGVMREKLKAYPVPVDRWATEAWSGIAFDIDEAGVIFSPPYGVNHLYSPLEMQKLMVYYDRWLSTNSPTPVGA